MPTIAISAIELENNGLEGGIPPEIELMGTHLVRLNLSIGDLCRAEQEKGGPNAETIEQSMESGKLVPNEIIVTLLRDAMETVTRTTGKNNFLLDGFPRSLSNLECWFEIFGRETELPETAFTRKAPLEGGPFVTAPGKAATADKEPRSRASNPE